MSEIWKDIYFAQNGEIFDYRGLYQVSSYGRVKSLGNDKTRKEKILKPRKDKGGYGNVALCKDGKQKNFKVHRLVAHMFLTGYFEGADVDHINTDRTDNRSCNLRWCSRKENCNNEMSKKHYSEASKGEKLILIDPITMQTVFTWQYKKQATEFYNINKSTLDRYLKGESKTGHEYNGFLFYYLEDWQQLNK